MRIIQYLITLIGSYSLFNHSDATNSESYGDLEYPGIRMDIMECSNLSDIADAFELAPIDINDNPDFIEHFRQTLLGKQTRWKIVRVVVNCNTVSLQFASKYYYKEYNRLYDGTDTSKMGNEEENDFLNSLPEYMGYANLDAKSLRAVVLRFETMPYKNCESGNIVDVSLSRTGPVTVTEYDGNKKCTFEIMRSQIGEYGKYPVIVTERM